jgi:hypothetical protein
MTRQGLRDLNYYGPRSVKSADEAPPSELVADTKLGPTAEAPVTAAVETQDGVTK